MDSEHVIPGNHARGWNDPPQFLYDAQKSNSSSGGLHALNKRVAHTFAPSPSQNPHVITSPITITHEGAGASTPVAPPSLLAPVPILSQNILPATASTEDTGTPESDLAPPSLTDESEMCAYCVQCFYQSAETLHKQEKIERRLLDDVKRRVVLFEKMWSTKLSDKAKPKCLRLARAMELAEWEIAHVLHLTLMTDHISEVSQWMVGVKKLIQAGQSS